jgi:hypothetical protein
MTSSNTQLNHSPAASWLCYTADGAQAAGKSNMTFGNGWTAINRYMQDAGSANADVGHRGWLLHPPTQRVGIGDVPGRPGNGAANTTWIWDDHLQDPAVPTRDACVATGWVCAVHGRVAQVVVRDRRCRYEQRQRYHDGE